MSKQIEKRKNTRKIILSTAAQTILDSGYAACSIAAIAKHSPFTTGAIQYHFKTKDDLLLAIITEHIFDAQIQKNHEIDVSLTVDKRCRNVVDAMWNYYGHSHYSVVWQVLLGAQQNRQLLAAVNRVFADAEFVAEKQIVELFSDIAISIEHAKQLIRFVSCHLRGVSILRFSQPSQNDIAEQLTHLVAVVAQQVNFYADDK